MRFEGACSQQQKSTVKLHTFIVLLALMDVSITHDLELALPTSFVATEP